MPPAGRVPAASRPVALVDDEDVGADDVSEARSGRVGAAEAEGVADGRRVDAVAAPGAAVEEASRVEDARGRRAAVAAAPAPEADIEVRRGALAAPPVVVVVPVGRVVPVVAFDRRVAPPALPGRGRAVEVVVTGRVAGFFWTTPRAGAAGEAVGLVPVPVSVTGTAASGTPGEVGRPCCGSAAAC